MLAEIVRSRLTDIRTNLNHGHRSTQQQLDAIEAELTPCRQQLRARDKAERLPLFDANGVATGTSAPRWICHSLGLRHRCAHILLVWRSPALGDSLVLQIRDWSKDDSPGHLDMSVGGHVTIGDHHDTETTAFAEMLQELGIVPADLESGELQPVGGYAFDESRDEECFHNSEGRDVFVAHLKTEAIGKVRFPDGEVAGIVLVPVKEARRLLEQRVVPMASALRSSLPKCLEKYDHPA